MAINPGQSAEVSLDAARGRRRVTGVVASYIHELGGRALIDNKISQIGHAMMEGATAAQQDTEADPSPSAAA